MWDMVGYFWQFWLRAKVERRGLVSDIGVSGDILRFECFICFTLGKVCLGVALAHFLGRLLRDSYLPPV